MPGEDFRFHCARGWVGERTEGSPPFFPRRGRGIEREDEVEWGEEKERQREMLPGKERGGVEEEECKGKNGRKKREEENERW